MKNRSESFARPSILAVAAVAALAGCAQRPNPTEEALAQLDKVRGELLKCNRETQCRKDINMLERETLRFVLDTAVISAGGSEMKEVCDRDFTQVVRGINSAEPVFFNEVELNVGLKALGNEESQRNVRGDCFGGDIAGAVEALVLHGQKQQDLLNAGAEKCRGVVIGVPANGKKLVDTGKKAIP